MTSSNSREQLIEATRELLWERGMVGISPKRIQEKAKVGHGSMYHHFGSKKDLALAAIDRNVDELLSASGEIFGSDESAYTKIEIFLRCITQAQKGCKVGSLTQDPDVMSDAEMRASVKNLFVSLARMLEGVITAGIKKKEFSADLDAAEASWMIISILQGAMVCARANESQRPYNAAVEAFLTMLKKK